MITDYLDKVQLSSEFRIELIKNLRKAWSEVEKDSLSKAAQLKAKIKLLEEQKGRLVMSLADNPEIKADIQEQIIFNKEEISLIHEELEKTLDIESDFNEFVEFSLRTVENWKSEWGELDSDDRERYEQLLFPKLFRVNHNNKVSTPEISAIYRYASTKKEPRKTLSYSYGGPSGHTLYILQPCSEKITVRGFGYLTQDLRIRSGESAPWVTARCQPK